MPKINWFAQKFIYFFVFIGFLASANILIGGEIGDKPEDVIAAYFSGLKEGDVQKLIFLLTDPLLSEKRELLEEDATYPGFLRNYYRDATMLIKESTPIYENNICILMVEFFFKDDGNPSKIKFYLKNTDSGWKISEETPIP
jgi:hypothetical protein